MRVAVLGLGNVGLNLLSIMIGNHDFHKSVSGETIEVVAAGDFRTTLYSKEAMDLARVVYYKRKGDLWGSGYEVIDREDLFEKEIDIIVDVTTASRTGEFGRDLYINAFRHGMDVATASKSPLANHWTAIMDGAEKYQRSIRYESTVAGGVPLFSFIDYCTNASPAVLFRGIVNGTANYVLSRVLAGSDIVDAINEAKSMGIAEADPSLDIDGYDNAWKSLIVANRLSPVSTALSDLEFEGIREYIERSGGVEKGARLVSEITLNDGIPLIHAGVKVLDPSDPLAALSPDSLGYYLETRTNRIGVTGYHDGPLETAAGVMNDIIILTEQRRKRD